MPFASPKVVLPVLLIDQLWIGAPKIPFLGLINVLKLLTEFREFWVYNYWFIIKDIIKDTDEEKNRARHVGRGIRSFYNLLDTSTCSTIQLFEHCPFGLLRKFHHIGMMEAQTTMWQCSWTKRVWSNAYSGETQQALSVQILLGLPKQHSFFPGMGEDPFWIGILLYYYQTE